MDNKLDKHSEFYTKKLLVKLAKREPISDDSYMFRFEFANPEEKLDMLITQHILIYGQNLKNEIVSRKYTAIADEKVYHNNNFRDISLFQSKYTGLMYILNSLKEVSQHLGLRKLRYGHLNKLKLNTNITIKRCIGKLVYENIGQIILKPKSNKTIQNFNTILLVCGGSGITPAYQVIQKICNNPQDPTKLILLYANRTEKDIWLRKELEEFQEKNKNFKVHYTLDTPSEGWKGFKGFITLEMLKTIFPQPDQGVLGVLCGPKPMNKLVIQHYLDYGLPKEQILKF